MAAIPAGSIFITQANTSVAVSRPEESSLPRWEGREEIILIFVSFCFLLACTIFVRFASNSRWLVGLVLYLVLAFTSEKMSVALFGFVYVCGLIAMSLADKCKKSDSFLVITLASCGLLTSIAFSMSGMTFDRLITLTPTSLQSSASRVVLSVLGSWPLLEKIVVEPMHFNWFLYSSLCFAVVYGSYSLDSKNSMCFFPGCTHFHRILKGSLIDSKDDSRQQDLRVIRNWVMSNTPSEQQSHHWWFATLPQPIHHAFDRCAKSPQINTMFRSLFSEEDYCVDIAEGMNEIYVTGPCRMDETANSDQIFDMRHVDGPWGFVPFVSVFRCLVGMDRNHVVSER